MATDARAAAPAAGRYVQYGCGMCAPAQWRNFDASPTLRFERVPVVGRLYTRNASRFPANVEYGDIVRGLPVAPDSCDVVYCSHVLEHLPFESFRVALRNTHRILRPGGIFRLVLPDLEYAVRQYLDDPSPDAAPGFMRETSLGQEAPTRGVRGALQSWLGNSQHLWMWDYKSMRRELESAGFTDVRRAVLGDAGDPMFALVEDRTRWNCSLGVQCAKAPA